MPNMMHEIWIIDDHQLFSAGLRQMLERLAPKHYIRCFTNPEQTQQVQHTGTISLIIMDYYIPDSDPSSWIKVLRKTLPNTPLIVISSSASTFDKETSLSAGASAYYLKHDRPGEILNHLTRFLNGTKPQDENKTQLTDFTHELTTRQTEILIQLARGNSNKKIAKILNISPETVKTHLSRIYKRTNCFSRCDAIEWARRKGLM